MDREQLRRRTRRGVRNATLMAIAPTASIGLVVVASLREHYELMGGGLVLLLARAAGASRWSGSRRDQ